ncbi:hypothetical protein J7443_16180 [Tropicibacter sp. R15_0]|uniref:helix-turn-helix transcriptional regulator n=1 Tax=Tropicibacter sp. R15_0 TaxID=2821101 RepID=UPI001ADB4EB3|nr:LuxR family transcriptional regulator [Tropicibacter sp. R15_0]MBO9466782.1 hypothetical protein [Tropicibacter sp. R15_0]
MSQLNDLIDMIDGFMASDGFDQRWHVAKSIARKVAGADLNYGELDHPSGALKWMSSTMCPDYLAHYMSSEYYLTDSIIDDCVRTNELCRHDFGQMRQSETLSKKAAMMHEDLHDLGYFGAVSQAFQSTEPNTRTGAVLLADRDLLTFGGPELSQNLQRVTGTLCAFLGRPDETTTAPVYFIEHSPLTHRETEVLKLLASGFQYARMAEKMGISEIMVRTHVKTARQKLQASTRDQAVAIAVRDGLIQI